MKKREKKESSVEAVKEWLSKEGFPLEMRVAQVFREHGFAVWQARLFKDPKTGKAREIDVIAEARYRFLEGKAGLRIVFVVECKLAASKPWVLLSAPDAGPASLNVFSEHANPVGRSLLSNLDQITSLPHDGVFLGPKRAAYGVILAFREDRKGETEAYSASQSVWDAASNLDDVGEHLDRLAGAGTGIAAWAHLRFPCVVIEGRLMETTLEESGELSVRAVEQGRLRQARPDSTMHSRVLDIVRRSQLDAYLSVFRREIAAIRSAVEEQPEILTEESLRIKEDFHARLEKNGLDGPGS